MAGLDQEKTCWAIYPPLLSILKTEKERSHLEEAAMAHQCGRFADSSAIYEHNLPTSSSIPMLAMEHADMLTTQGLERDRIKLLERTLNSHEVTNNGLATTERLLLELMSLDAYFWAYGKMEGLLDKALQVREQVSLVDMKNLSDLEVSFPVIELCYNKLMKLATGYKALLPSCGLLQRGLQFRPTSRRNHLPRVDEQSLGSQEVAGKPRCAEKIQHSF